MMRTLAGLACLLPCLACGDAGDPAREGNDELRADAATYEGCPATTPAFALGMQATGEAGKLRATLVAADPAPPMRYLNDWTLSFESVASGPLGDAQISMARPFMPVHGHDGNLKPTITRHASDGTFLLEGLNLNMRGPWEIQLQVSSPSAGDDYIVFHVCVVE
jgi:hypothetical protein